MTGRVLLKFLAMFPLIGPSAAKALTNQAGNASLASRAGFIDYELQLKTARTPADFCNKKPAAFFNEIFELVQGVE